MYVGDVAPGTAAYTAWVASVNAQGGEATVWPFADGALGVSQGTPAAKYPVQTYVSLFNLGQIDPTIAQRTSTDNNFVYVVASNAVAASATNLTAVTPAEAATLPGGASGFNPFANSGFGAGLSDLFANVGPYLKWGAIGLGGLLVFGVVSRVSGGRR